MMEIGRFGLIVKSARRGATRGDITTVWFKSNGRDESRKGGPASWDPGLFYAHNHGRRTDLHQIGRLALFSRNFLIKNWCSSLCNLTLDWIVKQLSDFWARSWVHRDPPAFRIDCDPIGAGLITKSCRIRSNFPLEHRTSAEEEIKLILFNPCELKPHLHGNQVSSEILSFILMVIWVLIRLRYLILCLKLFCSSFSHKFCLNFCWFWNEDIYMI